MLVRHLSGRQKRLVATNPQLKFIKKGQPAETSPAEAVPSIRQLKNPPFAEDKPRPNTVARSFGRMRRPLCHHARMGIILSHTTARAVYQTANSLASYATGPIPMEKIRVSAPTTSDLEAARAWLNRKNVDSERIHVLTFSNNAKRHRKGCICHCTRYTFDAESYLELEPNVYIVDIKLCALEATADLNLSELVEYYFEICGSYALETSDETQYHERPALTSAEELRAFFSEASGYRGSNKALKALSYVREGCRSPLETAFVMMLTMPKSMGGLAIRAIKTDYPIPVPKRYAALTRRTVFYFDALLENSMTDIEYNGFYHDEPEQQSIDEERRNTLRNMGYAVITVSRHSFFKQSAFRRVMEAIRIREKIWPGRLPNDFAILQENLRQFVLRRYFEYGRRVLEALKEEETTKHEIASQYPQADDPSINDVPEPDDMQHVGALAEEINGPWGCDMSAKIDENRTEDDAIIDLIENSLF